MGQPADRAQRVRVAVAQRLPLPLQRLLEQRPRLLQLTQVAQQIARVINRVQRVCVWRSPSVSLFARIASLLTCSCSSIYSSLASSGLPMSSSSSVRGRGTAQTPPAQPPAAARTPPAPERAGPRAASRRPARCTCRSPRPSPQLGQNILCRPCPWHCGSPVNQRRHYSGPKRCCVAGVTKGIWYGAGVLHGPNATRVLCSHLPHVHPRQARLDRVEVVVAIGCHHSALSKAAWRAEVNMRKYSHAYSAPK